MARKSSARKNISSEALAAAVRKWNGNVAAVARSLGVSRGTVYNRMKDDPVLVEAMTDSREEMLDNVESALYAEVLNRNITAMIFWLKTQGKHRGWVERQEISGPGGGAVHYEYDYSKLSDEELKAAILDEASSITRRAASSAVPMESTPPDAEAESVP